MHRKEVYLFHCVYAWTECVFCCNVRGTKPKEVVHNSLLRADYLRVQGFIFVLYLLLRSILFHPWCIVLSIIHSWGIQKVFGTWLYWIRGTHPWSRTIRTQFEWYPYQCGLEREGSCYRCQKSSKLSCLSYVVRCLATKIFISALCL